MRIKKPNSRTIALGVAALLGSAYATSASAGVLYFDFNRNAAGSAATASVFLFGAAGQTATVSTLSGTTIPVVLNADGFFNLPIANTFQQSGTGIRNTGFQVVSADPIAGYFVNRAAFTTDMTYLLDSEALGQSYVVASQGQGFGEGSQVAIHATEANTNVTFTPKGGGPINVVLQAGETYKYAGGATDLSGSTVTSDKDVAVFGGHECAQVPAGVTFCDTLLEQMIPTANLSESYLVTASQGANLAPSHVDLVRVIGTAAGTQVSLNGVLVATLGLGDVYQFNLAQNSGAQITATEPVMVAQYLVGGQGAQTDPAMSVVPGSDTWLASYRLSTPNGAQAFNVNYASVVVPTAVLASLQLNGVAVNTAAFTAIAGTTFSRGIISLPLGLFNLSASSPFLVMLGGGSEADSYFTYGGATFAPGISDPPDEEPPTSVPEPGTLALLGLGLLGLAAGRKRKVAA